MKRTILVTVKRSVPISRPTRRASLNSPAGKQQPDSVNVTMHSNLINTLGTHMRGVSMCVVVVAQVTRVQGINYDCVFTAQRHANNNEVWDPQHHAFRRSCDPMHIIIYLLIACTNECL